VTQAELTSQIKDYVHGLGSTLVGVANAERLAGAPRGHRPEDFLPGARSVVVMAMPILRAYARYPEFMKDSLLVPERVERKPGRMSYWVHTFNPRLAIANHVYRRVAYEALNMELQRQTIHLATHLDELGHDAIAMPTAYGSTFTWNQADPRPNLMGPFSLRHAAAAAGLGRFGMNNLIVTRRYGPLQRFAAVITTAALDPDPLERDDICPGEECSICKDTCPNQCFAGIEEYEFAGLKARMWAMNRSICGDYQSSSLSGCTQECLFKCPLGLKRR
jgi:epoxyqueuosine reductase QueG